MMVLEKGPICNLEKNKMSSNGALLFTTVFLSFHERMVIIELGTAEP